MNVLLFKNTFQSIEWKQQFVPHCIDMESHNDLHKNFYLQEIHRSYNINIELRIFISK